MLLEMVYELRTFKKSECLWLKVVARRAIPSRVYHLGQEHQYQVGMSEQRPNTSTNANIGSL
ncbi:hypothetical protein IAQ61_004457 [Plenodomus lingam]|uniref:uncharacterized protein n=1 Tax=Leptosphaeria maculans TaxID=5022 RepID=UPI0033171690|nr:hypothetical protein IAQ61_004457 [Plenodomus lingam]